MTTHAANDPIQAEPQPALDLALPIAKIRGEPLTELPQDLYIPPEALSVFLDALQAEFSGPECQQAEAAVRRAKAKNDQGRP